MQLNLIILATLSVVPHILGTAMPATNEAPELEKRGCKSVRCDFSFLDICNAALTSLTTPVESQGWKMYMLHRRFATAELYLVPERELWFLPMLLSIYGQLGQRRWQQHWTRLQSVGYGAGRRLHGTRRVLSSG